MPSDWLAQMPHYWNTGWFSQTGLSFGILAFVLVLLAAFLFFIYQHSGDQKQAGRLRKLFWLRLALVALLLTVIADFAFQKDVFQRQPLLIAIDTSSSSQLSILESDTQSRLAAVQAYFESKLPARSGTWQKLADRYQIQVVSIDRQIRWLRDLDSDSGIALPHDFIATLEADEAASCIGDGLIELMESNPATIVLFSDGATTSGSSLQEAASTAAAKEIPIQVVGLGSSNAPANLKLSNARLDRRVRSSASFPVTVSVEANSLAGNSFAVSIMDSETTQVLAEQTLTISSDRFSRQVVLPVQIDRRGSVELTIQATLLPGETVAEDNELRTRVDVVEGVTKVLLVHDLPSPSFRFLKESISRAIDLQSSEPLFRLSTFLQQASPDFYKIDPTAIQGFPSPDELSQFDVVIFGDASVDEFGSSDGNNASLNEDQLASLVNYVENDFGNLVFVFGPEHALSIANSPSLKRLLPFGDRSPSVSTPNQDSRLKFEPAAVSFGATQLLFQNRLQLEQLTFFPVVETDSTDFRSIPLLSLHPSQAEESESIPAISLQKMGSGTVISQLTNNLYRMRFRTGGNLYQRYWTRLISDLAAERLQSRGQSAILSTNVAIYDVSDPIELSAEFFDPTLLSELQANTGSASVQSVRVQLINENGRTESVPLYRDNSQLIRPRFKSNRQILSAGKYTAMLELDTAAAITTNFQVLDGKAESEVLTQQTNELQQLASETSAKYFNLSNVDQLWTELTQRNSGTVVAREIVPLWSLPWVPTAFAGITIVLLAIEWLFRRKWRLDP